MDTDTLVEQRVNRKVHEIIQSGGIRYFRHLESRVLEGLMRNKDKNGIIALG
jgi:shikimate kinase